MESDLFFSIKYFVRRGPLLSTLDLPIESQTRWAVSSMGLQAVPLPRQQ